MKHKNLFSVWNWALGTAVGVMLFTASCKKDNPIVPPINNPPQSTLQVTPPSGNSPLSVRVQGSATDPDGPQDIASYRTVMRNNTNSDSLVFTRNPLDTTLTLTCPSGLENVVYNFKAEVKDKSGANNIKTANVTVNKRPNSAPSLAPLNVSPLSGVAPLPVRIQESATDPDSLGDIVDYRVVVKYTGSQDSLVLTQNPLDTTITAYSPLSVSSYVRDRSGLEDRKGPISVAVSQPSLTQTATLEDSVNLRYNATLSNLNTAILNVKKNGQTILTRNIAQPSYTELFSYLTNFNITKGNYVFATTWTTPRGNDTTINTNAIIPNYLPRANFSGLQTDMNEEDTTQVTLQNPQDKNPEDNPVPLRNTTSLDGKTQSILNGNTLTIRALGDNSGQYGIRVEYGSNEGGINTSILQGQIYDLPRLQGRLESNETRLGIQGTLTGC